MQTAIITRRLPDGLTETTVRLRAGERLKAELIFLADEVPSAELLAKYVLRTRRIMNDNARRFY